MLNKKKLYTYSVGIVFFWLIWLIYINPSGEIVFIFLCVNRAVFSFISLPCLRVCFLLFIDLTTFSTVVHPVIRVYWEKSYRKTPKQNQNVTKLPTLNFVLSSGSGFVLIIVILLFHLCSIFICHFFPILSRLGSIRRSNRTFSICVNNHANKRKIALYNETTTTTTSIKWEKKNARSESKI